MEQSEGPEEGLERDDEQTNRTKKPKKRKQNKDRWLRNKAKKARVEGQELLDKNGEVIVRNQVSRDVECICGCAQKLTPEEKEFVYEQFRTKSNHESQNEYLRGCTIVTGTKTVRGKTERIFTHMLRFDLKTVRVCQKYFLGIHGIKRSRLRNKVLRQEVPIFDRRGKHPNHIVKTSEDVRDLMRIFISCLDGRESHYSMTNNPNRLYLDPELSVVKLHQKFLMFYTLTEGVAKLDVFRKIFNTEFNFKFGEPRTDKCSNCELLLTKIKSLKLTEPGNVRAIAELSTEHALHLENSQFFYDDYHQTKETSEDQFSLCFDYQKNTALPMTNVNKEYYIRQLWVCTLGIKDMKTGITKLFVYSETFAQKGANEVVTCLLWYINTVVPATVRTLNIFCDNNVGQNKNRFVFAALQNLVNNRFENIYLKFPVPGHSRMPIDADFGRIAISAKRFESVVYPSDIRKIIALAQEKNPFELVYLNSNFTDDLADDGTTVLDVKDFKCSLSPLFIPVHRANMKLITAREIAFAPNVKPMINYTGRFPEPSREIDLFKLSVSSQHLDEKIQGAVSAYDDFLPISPAKLKNLEELSKYIAIKPGLEFYNTIFAVVGNRRKYLHFNSSI